MHEWLINYGSWCLAPFGLLGMHVVGRKKSWGWVLSMCTQALWALYAVGTAQFGFLIGTCSYFVVYLRNWLGWRKAPEADPVLTALRAVYADLDATGRAGDEWAYEWVQECWRQLVPVDVRVLAGDVDAAEEQAATGTLCPRCLHLVREHDGEGCTVTIPQTEDPDFGPTQTCPCCERRPF